MEKPAETFPEKEKVLDQRQDRQLKVIEKLKQLRTSVSDFTNFVRTILSYFEKACEKFKAGEVANHFVHWTNITSDKEILSNVSGGSIELTDTPTQHNFNVQKFQPHKYPILDGEMLCLTK